MLGEQEDTHELRTQLLDALRECCLPKVEKDDNNNILKDTEGNPRRLFHGQDVPRALSETTFVDRIFRVHTKETRRCLDEKCGLSTFETSSGLDLGLVIIGQDTLTGALDAWAATTAGECGE